MWFAKSGFKALAVLTGALAFTGCGYSLKTGSGLLYEKEGIHTVHIESLQNNTLKPGVEKVVYNNLVRQLSGHGNLKLVGNIEDADAVLSGSIDQAHYFPQAITPATQIGGKAKEAVGVATVYNAHITCSFELKKITRSGPTEERKRVWSQNFSRNRDFRANTRIGVAGTTAAIINESEFDRAVNELSRNIGRDLREAMVSYF